MLKAHEVQAPAPSNPVDPALQAHTFEIEAVTAENFPAPQPVHEADAGPVLYVLKAHEVQVASPSDPVEPALQAHTFETEPVTAEYFLAPHPVHATDPGKGL